METNEIVNVQESPRTIEAVTGEILEAKRVGGEAILTIGKGLIEAKGLLEHGEWLPWLSEQVEFSERAAQNFMRLAKEWSNPQALADLGATKALTLLALPENERDEFIQGTHEVDGEEKTVAEMTTRELEQAIRERDEARKAAEDAEGHLNSALERLKKAQEDAKKDASCIGMWADKTATLEKELKELKSRPVEVAVQVDETAVKAAQAEAEKARAEQKAAEEARDVLSKQMEAAKNRLAELEEAAKVSPAEAPEPDMELAQFRLFLEQALDCLNKATGVLLKLSSREDPGEADKARAAMARLADKIREMAA